MGFAAAILVVLLIAIAQLAALLAPPAAAWAENALGRHVAYPGRDPVWILTIIAALGIIAGAIFLMPAVTAIVGGIFVDEIAEQVEREHYPGDPPARLAAAACCSIGSRSRC